MNKQEFSTILQSALWSFEGLTKEQIRKELNFAEPKLIETGIKLQEYLTNET